MSNICSSEGESLKKEKKKGGGKRLRIRQAQFNANISNNFIPMYNWKLWLIICYYRVKNYWKRVEIYFQ